eukprot:2230416-Ditylum_brightwellii.AAC.1
MSPQHWAQEAGDNSPAKDGTSCITLATSCILAWNKSAYKTTLPLDPFINTKIFYSASGNTRYKHFEAIVQELHQVTIAYVSVAFPTVKKNLRERMKASKNKGEKLHKTGYQMRIKPPTLWKRKIYMTL